MLLWALGLHSVLAFMSILGLVGFMVLGPDSLLSGAGAIDAGSRRNAALAAGIINGCGSAGPIVQEPLIGWLKTAYGVSSVFLLLVGISALAALASMLFWVTTRRKGIHL